LSRLGHFRQRRQNLLFREKDVFQRFMEPGRRGRSAGIRCHPGTLRKEGMVAIGKLRIVSELLYPVAQLRCVNAKILRCLPRWPCSIRISQSKAASKNRSDEASGAGELRGQRKLGQAVSDARWMQSVQAIFCRRRHQPRRPPLAKIRPGSPAPAIEPGTGAAHGFVKIAAPTSPCGEVSGIGSSEVGRRGNSAVWRIFVHCLGKILREPRKDLFSG
jgi:hypothetical protein